MLRAIRQRLSIDTAEARALVERAFRDHPTRRFAVRLWDGQEVAWSSERDFTLVFRDDEVFRRCLFSLDPTQFAHAYIEGQIDIEGDVWEAAGLASHLRGLSRVSLELGLPALRAIPKLVAPVSPHSVARDRRDIQRHYDMSDELFRLFLDEKMVYSCAYFAARNQNLERAQERKLDLVCKKLGLTPGDSLLDIGCGWGALVIWAARHYGVRAHGVTLSEHQFEEARRRVAFAGLRDRVTIELRHYAELPREAFDKVSSVGMYEHVGSSKIPVYLDAVMRTLRPGGMFLNHGITEPPRAKARGNSGGAFIFREVFPGAELSSASELQLQMEHAGFELLDVQSLRPHYALTLREWYRRFAARRAEAAKLAPERTLRVLELYLAGCSRAFEEGLVGVHQVLLAKPGSAAGASNGAPLTRAETFLWDEHAALPAPSRGPALA